MYVPRTFDIICVCVYIGVTISSVGRREQRGQICNHSLRDLAKNRAWHNSTMEGVLLIDGKLADWQTGRRVDWQKSRLADR